MSRTPAPRTHLKHICQLAALHYPKGTAIGWVSYGVAFNIHGEMNILLLQTGWIRVHLSVLPNTRNSGGTKQSAILSYTVSREQCFWTEVSSNSASVACARGHIRSCASKHQLCKLPRESNLRPHDPQVDDVPWPQLGIFFSWLIASTRQYNYSSQLCFKWLPGMPLLT